MAMKKNDLRTAANDIGYQFGTIKMWYDANKTHKKTGIVVESKTNELLFRKLLTSKTVFFATEGRENVEKVLDMVVQHNINGVIGIIDADFRRIDKKQETNPLMFLTDYHDTEMMCIFSKVWDNIIDFYVDKDKYEAFIEKNKVEFRAFIMSVCKPISVLRLVNERENLGLRFRTQKQDGSYDFIDYTLFIDAKLLKLDRNNMFKAVENKSNKPHFFKNNPEIVNQYESLLAKEFDLKELNNGHDILNILSLALLEAISNKKSSSKVTGSALENDFIKGYRKEDFDSTQLYQNIRRFQENSSFIFI